MKTILLVGILGIQVVRHYLIIDKRTDLPTVGGFIGASISFPSLRILSWVIALALIYIVSCF